MTPIVLVVDIRNLDGSLALVEELRCNERTRDVPVVAVHGRLNKKTRLHLENLADRRLTFSDLSRRTLQQALCELTGVDERSRFGAS